MWYVKVKDIPPAEIRNQIEEGLVKAELSLNDLLRKLGYIKLKEGKDKFQRLYDGHDDIQLLRRVSYYLGLDYEKLSGEISFTDMVEYLKFTFEPVLLRIPERTRPSQIFPVAFCGIQSFIQVAKFPKLLGATEAEQHLTVRERIRADYANFTVVRLFGPIIGYAYYYEFCKAKAYSVTGEILEDYEIEALTFETTLSVSKASLAAHGGFIPRLKNKLTGKMVAECPERIWEC